LLQNKVEIRQQQKEKSKKKKKSKGKKAKRKRKAKKKAKEKEKTRKRKEREKNEKGGRVVGNVGCCSRCRRWNQACAVHLRDSETARAAFHQQRAD
jgi:outer membrane biosynthesis protein TonB